MQHSVHFLSLLILDLLPSSFGGTYLGKLPLSKYDQYMSAVSITNLPFFSFPYSTGVYDMQKLVPFDPNGANIPYLGSIENQWAKLDQGVPESEVNLALKGAVFFYTLVNLKETVEVTIRLDQISMISSTYGSVPSKCTLNLQREPYFFVISRSKETFIGFIGLNINSSQRESFACFRLSLLNSTSKDFSICFWYWEGMFSNEYSKMLFLGVYSTPSRVTCTNYEAVCRQGETKLAMTLPLLTSVTPLIGKVQNIFSLIMTIILQVQSLQALGMNEKGIYRIPFESIWNRVFPCAIILNIPFSDSSISLMPTTISYLNGFLNFTESECSSRSPLYTLQMGQGIGIWPVPLNQYCQSPISLEVKAILACQTASRVDGIYSISTFLFSLGSSLMLCDFTTNWSGLELETLTTVLEEVGFSSQAKIEVETPSGDFKLLIIMGCLGVHFRFSSKRISPTPAFMKHIEAFYCSTERGRYSRMQMLSQFGFTEQVGSPDSPDPLMMTWNVAYSLLSQGR